MDWTGWILLRTLVQLEHLAVLITHFFHSFNYSFNNAVKIFVQRIYSFKQKRKIFIQWIYSFKKNENYSFKWKIDYRPDLLVLITSVGPRQQLASLPYFVPQTVHYQSLEYYQTPITIFDIILFINRFIVVINIIILNFAYLQLFNFL